eukprot:1144016-Pelagomonas_calceolata.AAC.4
MMKVGGKNGRVFAGRVAAKSRRRVRASRSMAGNPSDPHQLCFWLSPRLAMSSSSSRQAPFCYTKAALIGRYSYVAFSYPLPSSIVYAFKLISFLSPTPCPKR